MSGQPNQKETFAMKEQLFLDLCKTKASVLANGIAKRSYYEPETGCLCLTGHVIKACGHDPKTFSISIFEKDGRVLAVCRALYNELPPIDKRKECNEPKVNSLFIWNDKPERTAADVVALVQAAADKAGGANARS